MPTGMVDGTTLNGKNCIVSPDSGQTRVRGPPAPPTVRSQANQYNPIVNRSNFYPLRNFVSYANQHRQVLAVIGAAQNR
jgi:hypothetical protein